MCPDPEPLPWYWYTAAVVAGALGAVAGCLVVYMVFREIRDAIRIFP